MSYDYNLHFSQPKTYIKDITLLLSHFSKYLWSHCHLIYLLCRLCTQYKSFHNASQHGNQDSSIFHIKDTYVLILLSQMHNHNSLSGTNSNHQPSRSRQNTLFLTIFRIPSLLLFFLFRPDCTPFNTVPKFYLMIEDTLFNGCFC